MRAAIVILLLISWAACTRGADAMRRSVAVLPSPRPSRPSLVTQVKRSHRYLRPGSHRSCCIALSCPALAAASCSTARRADCRPAGINPNGREDRSTSRKRSVTLQPRDGSDALGSTWEARGREGDESSRSDPIRSDPSRSTSDQTRPEIRPDQRRYRWMDRIDFVGPSAVPVAAVSYCAALRCPPTRNRARVDPALHLTRSSLCWLS